jgi:DNA-3-methyladenine glycosylase II
MTATPRHTALLDATPPYRLAASLRALSGFAPCVADQCVVGTGVRKAFLVPGSGSAVVVRVGPRPDQEPGVAVGVYADQPLPTDEVTGLERAVTHWLGLSDDLRPFLAIASDDPPMAPLLAAADGLHQVRFASLAEGACYFLLTHRTSQAVAASRKRRIAADLGARIRLDGTEYVAFPALATLLTTEPGVLARYAGGQQRADRLVGALHGLAALVAERGEEWLHEAPYQEVREALLAIPGIGPFTAYAILLRVLGRPDGVPLDMVQFADVVTRVYGPGTPVDTVRERYGHHVGWWSYLARTALAWTGVPSTHSAGRRRVA